MEVIFSPVYITAIEKKLSFFAWKFSAWVLWAESSVFTKWVVFKRYRDQNRADVTHSANKQLEKVNNTQIFWAFSFAEVV